MKLAEPEYRNSAGRLLNLLEALAVAKHPIIDTIPNLYNLNPNRVEDKQQVCIAALADMHRVYREFISDMSEANITSEQRQAMLLGLAALEQIIYPTNFGGNFRPITVSEVALLRICATFIQQEDPILKEDIERIKASIDGLRKLVQGAGISPTLRKALLELIRLSDDAIARFNIYGARGLKKAYKDMLGGASEIFQETKDEDPGVWKKVMAHLETFDNIASRLLKYQPLLPHVAGVFLPLAGGS